MASDRFGSVSASHRTKGAEKWFKNATSDAKHKTVDKELQRIKNLGVVSVRKRHEDVSSPRESFISNESELSKKKSFSDMSQTPATDEEDMIDSPTLVTAVPEGEVQDIVESEASEKMIESEPSEKLIESEVSENIELPKVDSSPFIEESMQDTIETNATDEDVNNDDLSVREVGPDEAAAVSVQPAVSATQDLQRFLDDTLLPDDAAVTFAPGELSKCRPEGAPMSQQPSNRSSHKSTGSSVYSQTDSYVSLTVKNLINNHSSPASSLQSATTSASLPVSCGSPGTVISEMYILLDQAKKANPELADIHEKLLGLVNSLNVWHAAHPVSGSQDEVDELRKQVKELEHKCELQQVDLHERSAYHSKLKQDKETLLKKISTSNEEGDSSPTDPSPMSTKLMNRLSSGSNVSSASLVTNPRNRSRRLNPRSETPLPPQLPPPSNPLPPIPQQEPTAHHSVHKEHHEKVVKELLQQLQEQQSKSKNIIDTMETQLSVMTKQTLELQQSIHRLESELQAKQRPPPRSFPAPPPPAASATMPTYSNPKKKQTRRSFSLLTMFGKR
ncbi:hypothetical protein INT44_007844 [Umbelopsis vinacea]|uniref:Uncharacterized protein n=1 Tax=Umbelopsis vinacea TaxID=44442 RepID=A0A8H7U849_9FUNG|nr:hypothetical protein INT44_007844 [Umbelopsis vinacea]